MRFEHQNFKTLAGLCAAETNAPKIQVKKTD
jgi:hypothetical protein